MAYEKLDLVVAGLSGEIYLTNILKNGVMGNNRRVMTEECLRSATEWFLKNKKVSISYGEISGGKKPHLFYTDNEEKAKRITEILKEDSQ